MAEVCRKQGISEQTFYRWRRSSGNERPEARRCGNRSGKQSD
ncbi:transposase [bacterium]|nr:transposase [bacterium]